MEKKLTLEVVHPHAAGIDVGSRFHMVAVNQDKSQVREFGVYTKDHESMIAHLRMQGITTIAMESTGSYWQTLFKALQKAGFEVLLVGGNQTKNVKGRKTDVIDCLWIQKLHSVGMLSGSFLLSDVLQQLRVYYHHRIHIIEQLTKYSNKMQKALRLMNVRLDVVLAEITGVSGMAIIKAILAGSRDPAHLASLADIRVKKSREEIEAALQGSWRAELLYELKVSLQFYTIFRASLGECDHEIETILKEHQPSVPQGHTDDKDLVEKKKKKAVRKNIPSFDLSSIAYRYFNTDLFAIAGVSNSTVLCLLTTLGTDIKKFPTAKSFASWLRLTPNNKVSGGKVISSKSRGAKNEVAHVLRHAANAIGNLKEHELCSFFKRVAFKKGRIAAITATARKLATIIWNMITKAQPYQRAKVEVNTQKQRLNKIRSLQHQVYRLDLTENEIKRLLSMASPSATS